MDKDWYWEKGLHDAKIVDVRNINFEYDYTQRDPLRNMLEIILDTRMALFDNSIELIRFYNYKIIEGDENIIHSWWIKDEFWVAKGKNNLKIYLHSKKKTSELLISFEAIEVVRKES
jgi:hypothetical protein